MLLLTTQWCTEPQCTPRFLWAMVCITELPILQHTQTTVKIKLQNCME
jgi:hypothetical protein